MDPNSNVRAIMVPYAFEGPLTDADAPPSLVFLLKFERVNDSEPQTIALIYNDPRSWIT
jgi:hypothetical protein